MIDYENRPSKREIQKRLFEIVEYETFIGLAGPSPETYLSIINYQEDKKYIFIDNNKKIVELQKNIYHKYKNIKIYLGNINHVLNDPKAFYDLDYCCTIDTLIPYLPKIDFLNQFSLTVCLRNRQKGHKLPYVLRVLKKYLKNKYIYRTYKDNEHTPMLMIIRIND